MATPEEIQAQIDAIAAEYSEAVTELKPVQDEQVEITKEEQKVRDAYYAAIAEIRIKKQEADQRAYEAQRKANEIAARKRALEMELEAEKRRLEEERKAAEKAARQAEWEAANKALNERWDALTIGAPWREWAKDHQITGAHKLVEDRAVILADSMGLGKTLTSIITTDMVAAATKDASPETPFLGELKEVYVGGQYQGDEFIPGHYEEKIVGAVERPAGKKILYICPATMIRNVEAEYRKWTPHKSVAILGGMAKAERRFLIDNILPNSPEWVVICNYEAWRKDMALLDALVELDFDTIIIDEAHNAKDLKSITYRGIKKLIEDGNPPYVIPMTGTPILNRPQELFSLLSMVNPDEFYALNTFLFNYCEQDEDGFWKFKPGGLDRIAKAIRKNFLRRTKKDAGIELPPKTITMHNIEVDTENYPNQAKVRKQMRDFALIMVDQSQGKALAATAKIAVLTRLRQIETWPAGIIQRDTVTKEITLQIEVEESQKLDYVIHYNKEDKVFDGLIPEVVEDERVVVFSQFKAPLHELKDRIERMGKRAVILDGDTPKSLQDEIRRDFDVTYTPDGSEYRWDVVLCNYKVGGVGLNLTCATQMIILDEEWNPGKRDQAYDRIHRMGQEKPVTIHVIRNQYTVDDWLAGIMEKKEGLVDGFNSAMVDDKEFKDFLQGMGDSGLL
jgi:SNF2 family DNA or RNA helicase